MRMIELKGGEVAIDVSSEIAVQRHGDRFIVLGDGMLGPDSQRSNFYDLKAAKMRHVKRVDLSPEEIATRLEGAKK